MSLAMLEDRVVHFPKHHDVFQFDAEVSSIFPPMC